MLPINCFFKWYDGLCLMSKFNVIAINLRLKLKQKKNKKEATAYHCFLDQWNEFPNFWTWIKMVLERIVIKWLNAQNKYNSANRKRLHKYRWMCPFFLYQHWMDIFFTECRILVNKTNYFWSISEKNGPAFDQLRFRREKNEAQFQMETVNTVDDTSIPNYFWIKIITTMF